MKNYPEQLDEFVFLCNHLIDKGMPYISIIACHELYRFLYPYDGYSNIDFDKIDHQKFIEWLINGLKSIMQLFDTMINPYNFNLNKFNDDTLIGTLEESTSNMYMAIWDNEIEKSVDECVELLNNRLPKDIVKNKEVLDMGCGSGRYSLALLKFGAKKVIGVDYNEDSFHNAKFYSQKHRLNVNFYKDDVNKLWFKEKLFGFVFCNGVLHHTVDIRNGLKEIKRILKDDGKSFIYLYGSGGIFWETRRRLRLLFEKIPFNYTKSVLNMIGMPKNRFIFLDTWYVPIEQHFTKEEVEKIFDEEGFKFKKIVGNNKFDFDRLVENNIDCAKEIYGCGEHRYILEKK